jgi:hypothetical protein
MTPSAPSTLVPLAVIDTQSILDWLYFLNPTCADWERQRLAGQWRWIATPAMRDELAHVLGRGVGGPGRTERAHDVLAHFDQHIELLTPAPAPLSGWPRCTDHDDQKFIDLALSTPARWLVSRDKAVLKLTRKAWQLRKVSILRPADWQPAPPEPTL